MKYSFDEHEGSYQRIAREQLGSWNHLHSQDAGDDPANRWFLGSVLPRLRFPASEQLEAFEYGCGTGQTACFLAERGYRVRAIDLSPTAIALARKLATERGLPVDFDQQDVCALAREPPDRAYDLIVDCFCLQSVVTDQDRADLLQVVGERLRPTGLYLISTAMYDGRVYPAGERYQPATGICELIVRAPTLGHPAAEGDVCREGVWYRPHRRHLTPGALRRELIHGGLRVLWQGGSLGGDVVGVRSDYSGPGLAPRRGDEG